MKLTLAFLASLLLAAFAVAQARQLPQQAPPLPASAASYDQAERLLYETLAGLRRTADTDCAALDTMKQYRAQLDKFVTHVEARFPGYTVGSDPTKPVVKPKP